MDNRIEKIRAEINRLHSKWMFVSTAEGYYKCKLCNQLLKFIDSLQEEPVSEDLEEESKKYSSCIYLEEVLSDDDKEVLRERLINTFKTGAQWQKQQMIVKAIDAHCFGFQGAALFSFRLPADNYLVGSKVKVIVIKED